MVVNVRSWQAVEVKATPSRTKRFLAECPATLGRVNPGRRRCGVSAEPSRGVSKCARRATCRLRSTTRARFRGRCPYTSYSHSKAACHRDILLSLSFSRTFANHAPAWLILAAVPCPLIILSCALVDLFFDSFFLPALRAPFRDLSARGGRMLYGAPTSALPPSGFTARRRPSPTQCRCASTAPN